MLFWSGDWKKQTAMVRSTDMFKDDNEYDNDDWEKYILGLLWRLRQPKTWANENMERDSAQGYEWFALKTEWFCGSQ